MHEVNKGFHLELMNAEDYGQPHEVLKGIIDEMEERVKVLENELNALGDNADEAEAGPKRSELKNIEMTIHDMLEVRAAAMDEKLITTKDGRGKEELESNISKVKKRIQKFEDQYPSLAKRMPVDDTDDD